MDRWQGKVGILVGWGQVGRLGGLRGGRLGLLWRRRRPLELRFLSLGHPAVDVVPLPSGTGGDCGVGPGGGGEGDLARGGAEVVGPLLLLLLVLLVRVVLFEADVPGQAADGRHRLELMDDVPRDEVDVVVTQLHADVADAFPPQLVEFGIVHPLDTLHTHTVEKILCILFCL